MKDSTGSIIYVGKSKNLKSRVSQYFQSSKNHSPKVIKMVKNIKDFDYIRTDTELEALLLECELIVKLQPAYNRQMKNPKGYCYIRISINEEYPGINISIEEEKDGALYFGPYRSLSKVERAVKCLEEELKIRRCTRFNTGHLSGCLNYHLGGCPGPCIKQITAEEYMNRIDLVLELLSGKSTLIIDQLTGAMIKAAEELDFIRAAKLRDDIEALRIIENKVLVSASTSKRRNIIALEPFEHNAIKVFFIKGNKILGKDTIFYNNEYLEQEEVSALSKDIVEKALLYLKGHKDNDTKISKQELDEQQIIYSYLSHNKGKLHYSALPASYLKSSNCSNLLKKVEVLIKDMEMSSNFTTE